MRAHPLISQTMVVGDNRPFIACLITLDPEALDHWKSSHGKPADATPADLAADPDLLAELQAAVDDANKAVSRAESIRKFTVLASDFTEASGHLTPSLKVKRAVVAKDYAAEIEALCTANSPFPDSSRLLDDLVAPAGGHRNAGAGGAWSGACRAGPGPGNYTAIGPAAALLRLKPPASRPSYYSNGLLQLTVPQRGPAAIPATPHRSQYLQSGRTESPAKSPWNVCFRG